MKANRSLAPDQVRTVRATYAKLLEARDRARRMREELTSLRATIARARAAERDLSHRLGQAHADIAEHALAPLAKQFDVPHTIISKAARGINYKEIR